jgi:hypothetical protein
MRSATRIIASALLAATLGAGCATTSTAPAPDPRFTGHYACSVRVAYASTPIDPALRRMLRTSAPAGELADAARRIRNACVEDATRACIDSSEDAAKRSDCMVPRVAACEASYRQARDMIACR